MVADKRHETLLRGIRPEFPEPDRFVEPTISPVNKGTHTGEIGDGIIFVLSGEESVRIDTRQTADAAIGSCQNKNRKKKFDI